MSLGLHIQLSGDLFVTSPRGPPQGQLPAPSHLPSSKQFAAFLSAEVGRADGLLCFVAGRSMSKFASSLSATAPVSALQASRCRSAGALNLPFAASSYVQVSAPVRQKL